MDILNRINKLLQPVKQAVNRTPLRHLLMADFAKVSFTDPQNGNQVNFSCEYLRDGNVVYLILPANDERFRNFARGIPVRIQTGKIPANGWAEVMNDSREFFDLLSKNPERLAEFKESIGLEEELGILNLDQLKALLAENQLIRVKISR